MDTPIEESNLAHIGSDEDKAAKKAAAEIEMNWEGAGKSPGIQIWRVENTRDENDNPKFGINKWPKKKYGQFYTGDSYIVLETTADEEDGGFFWDIYFWIGSESTQDEYGVAAYKANELDDLLDDAPVQHRETQGYESPEFLDCFPKGIRYLEGGIDGGFRSVADEEPAEMPTRLFHLRKREGSKKVHMHQVKVSCSSLNEGDSFVLDTGYKVYTWFGEECSPFEKNKAAEIAHNLAHEADGVVPVVHDVEDSDEEFWGFLAGSKSDIKSADEVQDRDIPTADKLTIYRIYEERSFLKTEEVEPAMSSLKTGDVYLIDAGQTCFLWLGKESSKREQQEGMDLAQGQLKAMGRERNTQLVQVRQGKEKRNKAFKRAMTKSSKKLFSGFSF